MRRSRSPTALSTKEITAGLTGGGASRVLVENIIAPNVGPVASTLDEMSSAVEQGPPAAFKVYTAWSPSGQGFSLEDPAMGLPTVQHTYDLGVKVFVAHKGLPLVNFDPAFNGPDDIVAVSRQFIDMQFVVYHAAWDPSHVEGPYNPSATIGIDSLLAALDKHGVSPDDNVWVDVATLWRQLLTQPDQAAHAIGKLLKRVGTSRVLSGHGRCLVRKPGGADHGHAVVRDQSAIPGALRLSGAHRSGEGGPVRAQCGRAFRHRPDRDAVRADVGSAQQRTSPKRPNCDPTARSRRRGRPTVRRHVVRC